MSSRESQQMSAKKRKEKILSVSLKIPKEREMVFNAFRKGVFSMPSRIR